MSSGILRYDDTINDMTFFRNFKYTTKGPHSLGGKNTNSIGIKYRAAHPSYIGNIDLTVCGNSDWQWSAYIEIYMISPSLIAGTSIKA